MENIFVIPAEKVELLRGKLSHIASLFKEVQVHILQDFNRDSVTQWIRLSCSTSSKMTNEELEKAKDYIDALCEPRISHVLRLNEPDYPASRIRQQIFNLEKMFAVVATVDDNLRELTIKGSDMNVVLAESWIDKNHSNSLEGNQEVDLDVTDGSLNPSLKEFALKLGYSEKDVNTVAKKFGLNVDQNKLLRELINYTGKSRSDTAKVDLVARGPSAMKTGQIVARGARSVSSTAHGAAETHIWDSGSAGPAVVAKGAFPSTPSAGTQGLSSCEGSHNSLLPIVIDGSNVAMNHGNQKIFSCRGIELCVNWFKERGHREIYAFVPLWRTETPRPDYPMTDQHILRKLANQNFVKYTPSRRVAGRNIVCYDDRFIVDLAHKVGGVIVSNDNYRDIQRENSEWKDVIENRLLMYSFVGDYFMPPDDPLGKHGPTLKEFLQKGTKSHPRICPHISRCTYGSKCRFYHPERDPKKRQELLSGEQRQVGSIVYDPRNQRLTRDVTPKEIPNKQHPWHYASPSQAVTTSQHFTYSAAPYHSYNNNGRPTNENIEHDEHYERVIVKIRDIFGEDKESLARAMQRLPSVYSRTRELESIIDTLLSEG